MDTPELSRGTGATVEVLPQFGMDGAVLLVVVIKQRYVVDRRGGVHPVVGAVVRRADTYWDAARPERSSVKLPSDVCVTKPGTDVVLVGSAVGTNRPRVRSLDVGVRVGPLRRVLRVHGLRVWYRGVVGLALTEPEPFEELPLRWEYAWGGADGGDGRYVEEPRNPVGRGVARVPDALVHQPGPLIEDVREPVTGPLGSWVPAGVGAIAPHWAPRRGYAGTMDAHWRRERMPLPPVDRDPRQAQVAAPELVSSGYLRGGEPVELANVSAEGGLRFEVPRRVYHVGARRDGGVAREHPPVLDTVLLLPGERALELTWRAAVPWAGEGGVVRALRVHEKELR